jgi:hypothetical protein
MFTFWLFLSSSTVSWPRGTFKRSRTVSPWCLSIAKSVTGVFLPLTDYLLAQEWLVSENELLPKVVCHEWWAYELTDDRNSRSTLFLPIQRCCLLWVDERCGLGVYLVWEFFSRKEVLLLSHIVQKFSECGTVGCVSGTW